MKNAHFLDVLGEQPLAAYFMEVVTACGGLKQNTNECAVRVVKGILKRIDNGAQELC